MEVFAALRGSENEEEGVEKAHVAEEESDRGFKDDSLAVIPPSVGLTLDDQLLKETARGDRLTLPGVMCGSSSMDLS